MLWSGLLQTMITLALLITGQRDGLLKISFLSSVHHLIGNQSTQWKLKAFSLSHPKLSCAVIRIQWWTKKNGEKCIKNYFFGELIILLIFIHIQWQMFSKSCSHDVWNLDFGCTNLEIHQKSLECKFILKRVASIIRFLSALTQNHR